MVSVNGVEILLPSRVDNTLYYYDNVDIYVDKDGVKHVVKNANKKKNREQEMVSYLTNNIQAIKYYLTVERYSLSKTANYFNIPRDVLSKFVSDNRKFIRG